jgi:hypothetical protein
MIALTKVKVGFTVAADIGDARNLQPFARHLSQAVFDYWNKWAQEHDGAEFDVEVGPVKMTGSRLSARTKNSQQKGKS